MESAQNVGNAIGDKLQDVGTAISQQAQNVGTVISDQAKNLSLAPQPMQGPVSTKDFLFSNNLISKFIFLIIVIFAFVIIFSIMGIVLLFLIQFMQSKLPLNPQKMGDLSWDLALINGIRLSVTS
jgi:hypothetical protein